MTEAEKAAALEEMISAVSNSGVAAFGIMDYWTFDGYWALRDYLASTGKTLGQAIFPGMELRIEAPVDYRLNIHVILSDSLSKQQLNDFRGALRLCIGKGDRPLSEESLIEYAA